jgi:membrane protein implicated in regulation of membrane protease activity
LFFFLALILLFLLPAPWNLVGLAAGLAGFAVEVVYWHRKVRGRKAVVGAQTLIGRQATVIKTCRPRGQVRVGGEIWRARSARGADRGEIVTIIGRHRLTLEVEQRTNTSDGANTASERG